jgi:hypothetical protein
MSEERLFYESCMENGRSIVAEKKAGLPQGFSGLRAPNTLEIPTFKEAMRAVALSPYTATVKLGCWIDEVVTDNTPGWQKRFNKKIAAEEAAEKAAEDAAGEESGEDSLV